MVAPLPLRVASRVDVVITAFAARADGDGPQDRPAEPVALLSTGRSTILLDLVAAARAATAGTVTVLTRPRWHDAIAAALGEQGPESAAVVAVAEREVRSALAARLLAAEHGLLLADASLAAPAPVLASLAAGASTAIVTADATGGRPVTGTPVAVDRGRVVGFASAGAGALAVGLLRIGPADAARAAAALTADAAGHAAAADLAPIPAVLEATLRAGRIVTAADPRAFPIGVAHDPASALAIAADVARTDVDRARIANAVKAADGPFTTFLVSPYSRFIAAFGARHRWTPNGVTIASLIVGLVAAGLLTIDSLAVRTIGAVVLLSSFVLDCVDGQLARLTLRFSRLGGWLDLFSDRVKEYALVAALAVGAGGDAVVWRLALVYVAALGVRHIANVAFAETDDEVTTARQLAGSYAADAAMATTTTAMTTTTTMTMTTTTAPPAQRPLLVRMRAWVPVVLRFSIGDRLAVVAVAVVVAGQRAALLALVVGGTASMLVQLAIRLRRSVGLADLSRVPTPATRLLADLGVLDRARRRAADIGDTAAGRVPLVAAGVTGAGAAAAAAGVWADVVALAVGGTAVLAAALVLAVRTSGSWWWTVAAVARLAEGGLLLAVTGDVAEPWLALLVIVLIELRLSGLTFQRPVARAAVAIADGPIGGVAVRAVALVACAVTLDRLDVVLGVAAALVGIHLIVETARSLRGGEAIDSA